MWRFNAHLVAGIKLIQKQEEVDDVRFCCLCILPAYLAVCLL